VEGAAGGTIVQAAAIHGDVHVHGRRPPAAVPHHLPGPTRYFVNRHRELAALTSLLKQPSDQRPAVVVLVGLPGIGSSALAETWLAGQQDRFPDGVFSPTSPTRRSVTCWASSYGQPASPGTRYPTPWRSAHNCGARAPRPPASRSCWIIRSQIGTSCPYCRPGRGV
jgi:hypothetical protein